MNEYDTKGDVPNIPSSEITISASSGNILYGLKPYLCPVCLGKGIVPGGFYNCLPGCNGTSNVTSEPCRSCGGRGIIVC